MLKIEKRCTVYAVALDADGMDGLRRYCDIRGTIRAPLDRPLGGSNAYDFEDDEHGEEVRFCLAPEDDTPAEHAKVEAALAVWLAAARRLPA